MVIKSDEEFKLYVHQIKIPDGTHFNASTFSEDDIKDLKILNDASLYNNIQEFILEESKKDIKKIGERIE